MLEGATLRPVRELLVEEPRALCRVAHLGHEAEGVLVASKVWIEPGRPRHERVEPAKSFGAAPALGVKVSRGETLERVRCRCPQPEPHFAPGPVAEMHFAASDRLANPGDPANARRLKRCVAHSV